MELNAPRWKETVRQGEARPSLFGDVVTQDNIGSPLNKASANYDDHSNRRFLRWLNARCASASAGNTSSDGGGSSSSSSSSSSYSGKGSGSNRRGDGRMSGGGSHSIDSTTHYDTMAGCSPEVLLALGNASFNIRDHIAAARASNPPLGPQHSAMEACGASQFGPQDLQQVAPGTTPKAVRFEDGKCLTVVSKSSTVVAAPCMDTGGRNGGGRNASQMWYIPHGTGVVVSSRTVCAGRSNTTRGLDCCLTISSGSTAPGTPLQLYGCDARNSKGKNVPSAAFTFRLEYPHPGIKITRLVSNTSGLCTTAGVGSEPDKEVGAADDFGVGDRRLFGGYSAAVCVRVSCVLRSVSDPSLRSVSSMCLSSVSIPRVGTHVS